MTALTIAGSDSSGGAGLQADIKTFAAFGVHGLTAVTAVTAQTTDRVAEVLPMPAALVRAQIEAAATEGPIRALKTGMLATREIVETVCDAIPLLRVPFVVVDPVLRATAPGGPDLLEAGAVDVLKRRLLPLAAVVTPNALEASVLSGIEVTSMASARQAAQEILRLGPRVVVVKGGHLPGEESVDVVFDGSRFQELSAPRLPGPAVRGTGCAFSAAIAAAAALGHDLESAVREAKQYITGAIAHAEASSSGARRLAHFWPGRPAPRRTG